MAPLQDLLNLGKRSPDERARPGHGELALALHRGHAVGLGVRVAAGTDEGIAPLRCSWVAVDLALELEGPLRRSPPASSLVGARTPLNWLSGPADTDHCRVRRAAARSLRQLSCTPEFPVGRRLVKFVVVSASNTPRTLRTPRRGVVFLFAGFRSRRHGPCEGSAGCNAWPNGRLQVCRSQTCHPCSDAPIRGPPSRRRGSRLRGGGRARCLVVGPVRVARGGEGSHERDASRHVPRAARRDGLDPHGPAHRAHGSSAHRARRAQCPPARANG